MSGVEAKKNQLNLEIRELLSIIEMIDDIKGQYLDYKENTQNEEEYLDDQIKLVIEAKNRLINVFKD